MSFRKCRRLSRLEAIKCVTRSCGKMPKPQRAEAATHEKTSSSPAYNAVPFRPSTEVTPVLSTKRRYWLATGRLTHNPGPQGIDSPSLALLLQSAEETL